MKRNKSMIFKSDNQWHLEEDIELDRSRQTDTSNRLLSLKLYFSILSIENLFTSGQDIQITDYSMQNPYLQCYQNCPGSQALTVI